MALSISFIFSGVWFAGYCRIIMKNIIILLSAVLYLSCNSTLATIFGKKTAHEKYADKIEDKFKDTPEGRQWLAASKPALEDAQSIQLPYRIMDIFSLINKGHQVFSLL